MSLAEQLASYILSAMISWIPLGNQYERGLDGHWLRDSRGYYVQEDQAQALARYEATARDIASVALDEDNVPLFRGSDGRVKTALLLAAIASFEGGYHKWVEDGVCNTAIFKKDHPHECDGGHAWTNWQIHMYQYVIKGGEMTQAQYLENSLDKADRDWIKEHKDDIIRPEQLTQDKRLAALVAYYLARYSLRNFQSLCSYSGEDCLGRHPKADQRKDRAVAYLRAHPFTFETEPAAPPADLIEQQILEIVAGVSPLWRRSQILARLQLN